VKASGWLPSAVTKTDVTLCDAFSSSSVVSRVFFMLCVYSKFGHHTHPLEYLCVKFFSFAASIAELAHATNSRTQSLSHSPSLFDAPESEAFASEQQQFGMAGVEWVNVAWSCDNSISQSRFYQL